MVAYVIAESEIKDPEAYRQYTEAAPATIAQFGGKFLVRGGPRLEVLEGDGVPRRLVVLEFETFEQAKLWYDSPEYAGLKDLNSRVTNRRLIIVEGRTEPTSQRR